VKKVKQFAQLLERKVMKRIRVVIPIKIGNDQIDEIVTSMRNSNKFRSNDSPGTTTQLR